MSLDVSLRVPGEQQVPLDPRIYIRREGRTVDITRDEWDELRPDCEPFSVVADDLDDGFSYIYDANITHNLGRMATECGPLYDALWHPDEHGWTHARDLIKPLRDGLAILNTDRERLQEFNPANGWGDYDLLARFTAGYLAACERWPNAEVTTSS